MTKHATLITSLVLHGLAFLCIGFYIDFSSPSFPLGEANAIASYTITTPLTTTRAASAATPDTPKEHKKAVIALAKALPKKTSVDKDTHTATQKSAANATQQGRPTSELVALLHAAIQKQQRYPASALQMEREGRVSLKFTLYANGSVSHLTVMRSSGTTSLDEAALNAVRDAVPFQRIDQYLSEPQEYRIDVIFELT